LNFFASLRAILKTKETGTTELLALAEAKLFELKTIEFLERTEINKVLAEQKLSGLKN
jgi:hypothetical protein